MSGRLDPERWARVEAVFEEAMALPQEERTAFLAEAYAGEAWLREEVESLLGFARTGPGDRIDDIVEEAAARLDSDPPSLVGAKLGPYRLEDEIGRGGMGVVYLGVREGDDFDQRVAIKLLPGALFSEEMRWRFRNERRILASLEHPGVARFLDGGTTPEGVPYVVMEYVDGEPVDAFCEREGLDLEDRLWLVARICDVVRYAHGQLVVHRDLKPANILIDAGGAPKLLDFGIAKLVEPDGDLTRTATRIMTPHFASPEQMVGAPATIATDVYALGALMYLLLTGVKAFEGASSRAELARLVSETDPPPPSQVSRDRRLEGDLDTIVLKAMRRDPAERYASVDLFVRDIHAYLASLPISARPPTLRYRVGKFVRRNMAAVVAALLAVTGGVAGAGAATVGMLRARAAEASAQEEARLAEEVSAFLVQLFEEPNPDNALGDEMTARELLEVGVERIDAELAGQPLVQARLKSTMAKSFGHLGDYATAEGLYLTALEQASDAPAELRAELWMSLGGLRRNSGDLEGALAALDEAIAIAVPLVDTTDAESMAATPKLAAALIGAFNEIGVVLSVAGDYETAVDTMEHAFRLRERLSGPDAEETAAAAAVLASGYGYAGDFDSSATYYRRAIAIFETIHDERHPSRLIAMDGLGATYAQAGVLDSASTLFERLLPLLEEVYGPDHVRTAQTLLNLGALNMDRGDFETAEEYMRRALAIEIARFGPDNIGITSALLNLGIIRSELGDLEEAEGFFTRAADIRRAEIGADNPRFASALLGAANTRRQLGRWQESADAYAEALDVLRAVGGVPPPALTDYAEVLRALGRDAEADEIEAEAAALEAANDPGG